MPRKIKDTDYLYSATRVRAMERTLFGKPHAERMLEARSMADALKVLQDCGYGDISDTLALEPALSLELTKTYTLIASLISDTSIIDVFRLKYDYHNLKALIKGDALSADNTHMLIDLGRVPAKKMIEMVRMLSFHDMPPVMANAASEARELLARTSDPQVSDFFLDHAMFDEMVSISQKTGSAFLLGYVLLYIDACNLRALVRTERTGGDRGLLRHALAAGGSVGVKRILDASSARTSVAELFSPTKLREAASLAESASDSARPLIDFERAVDNALVSYLSSAKYVAFGEQPLVAYIAAKEAEAVAVRTIVAGRAAGLTPERIRTGLRDFYV